MPAVKNRYRNMSFMLTQPQIVAETKTVTRRTGWANLKPGDLFWAVEKCQGLKKGEKLKRLKLLRCVANTPEPLNRITKADCRMEGFPELTPQEFVAMFCANMRCQPEREVRRIEFEYVRG